MSTEEKFVNIAKQYFYLFSEKNINELQKMFDPSVTLRDWDLDVKGIDKVVKANSTIFESVSSIKVFPINLIYKNLSIAAELKILVNNSEEIKVVDWIDFTSEGKIKSIRAFKG